MRLHGIVFAYMLGIPFLSIAYDPKNQNFCESIGYPNYMSFDFYALTDVKPVIESLNILFKENTGLFTNSLPVKNATELVNTNLNLLTQEMNKILS